MIFVLLIAGLACTIAAGVAVIGVMAPPQFGLYAYLALWLIVPKALRLTYLTGGRYDLPQGITVFNVLEAIVTLGVLIAMLTHPKQPAVNSNARSLKRLSAWLLAAGAVSLLVSLGVFTTFLPSSVGKMSSFLGATTQIQYRILPVLSMLYAAVFIFGCARFIRTMKQAEPFFWLFALSGGELALERIVFVNLHLSAGLQQYAVQSTGRLNSLVFTSYDFVGVFAILSLCASLYLILSGRRFAWITFAGAWIALLGGYQRAPLLGALAATLFVVCSVANKRNVLIGLVGFVTVFGSLLLTNWDHKLFKAAGQSLGGQVRTDYFNTDDASERLALGTRAVDVFTFTFPAGVGPEMAAAAMNYPIPDVHPSLGSALGNQIYASLANGTRTTNPHDFYLEFLVDFGGLAVPLIGAFLFTMARLFAARLRRKDASTRKGAHARAAQICSFAMLVGLGVHGLINAPTLPYFVYIMPAYLAVVAGATGRRAKESPEAPRRATTGVATTRRVAVRA